jgi:hypothetical protein
VCASFARFRRRRGEIVPFVARRHAESLGFRLNIEDLELEILRARILLRAIDFGELRARFVACLSACSPPL